jgi:phosphoglycerate dehydrogenase-like enzyme
VLSPHVGWLTGETFERSMAVAVENCRRLMAGGSLLNQVI